MTNYTTHADSTTATTNGTPAVPAELRELRQWVAYRPDKVPIDPATGRPADTTDPTTWGTYDAAATRAATDGLPGVGFVLTADDPYAGVDLDDCRDPDTGQLDPGATAIVTGLDSYAEVSPSGTGVHVIVKGTIPGSRNRKGKVEMYDRNRYLTFTGQHIADAPQAVNDRQLALDGLYYRVFGTVNEPDTADTLPAPTGLSDDAVIAKLFTDKNAAATARLWSGDISDYDDDDSRARAALIRRVGFYTGGDVQQVERIMRRSALDKSKWDSTRGRQTFIEYEIRRCLAGVDETYTPSKKDRQEEVHHIESTRELLLLPSNQFLEEVHQGGSIDELLLNFRTLEDMAAESTQTVDWVAWPAAVTGALTDFIGRAKYAGKTRYIVEMSKAVLNGAPFLGRPTRKGPVVYLTEQGSNFMQVVKDAGIDVSNPDLHILQWKDVAGKDWPTVITAAVAVTVRVGAVLLVVDTLPQFAGLKGDAENNSGDVAAAMEPLQAAAQVHNLAVISVRHANKEGGGRGSTQFDHAVDIIINLQRLEDKPDNVRQLAAVGRYSDLPDKLLIELTDDGYRSLGTDSAVKHRHAADVIRETVPVGEENKVRYADVIKRVREETGVSEATAKRAVELLEDSGEIASVGGGKGKTRHVWRTGAPAVVEIVPGDDIAPNDVETLRKGASNVAA
jgi:putative DNA primase/helicase